MRCRQRPSDQDLIGLLDPLGVIRMTDRTMRTLSFGLVPLEMAVNGRQIKKETVVPTGIANGLPLTCNHAFSVVYQ